MVTLADLIFIGTAEFGQPSLEALNRKHQVSLVITQPDRPAGRGLEKRESPIKKAASDLNLPLYQPEDINSAESKQKIDSISPFGFVVAAYGQILSGELLDLVSWPLNIHGSLLPKYRGAAPINWAVINGEERTGVTTMVVEESVDQGPILLQKSVPIGPDETAGEVHDKLAEMGGELILDTIKGLEEGTLEPQPQPDEGTYAPQLSREDGEVCWGNPSKAIHDKIRGMSPWPGAFTYYGDRRVKILESRNIGELDSNYRNALPGEVLDITEGGITVFCGNGTALAISRLQPASREALDAKDFVNGFHVNVGDTFGDSDR